MRWIASMMPMVPTGLDGSEPRALAFMVCKMSDRGLWNQHGIKSTRILNVMPVPECPENVDLAMKFVWTCHHQEALRHEQRRPASLPASRLGVSVINIILNSGYASATASPLLITASYMV
jgi:hypothetical protein